MSEKYNIIKPKLYILTIDYVIFDYLIKPFSVKYRLYVWIMQDACGGGQQQNE